MAAQTMQDEIVHLRARLDAQEAEIARLKRRRHAARRFLPLALVGLLVALLPLSLLAAGPFGDLNPGRDAANADIQAIADAGITKGCNPPDFTAYCPNDTVTREQMASFLARTAGLGGNAPVANAKTAQTAANAAALGGQPASAYLPAAGDTIMRYSPLTASLVLSPGSSATLRASTFGNLVIETPANAAPEIVLPLPRQTGEHGRILAVKSLRVCYTAEAGILIGVTSLKASERGNADLQTLISDGTDRVSLTPTCYDLAPATPQAIAGQTFLHLLLQNTPGATRNVTLHSIALTLTSVATGTP